MKAFSLSFEKRKFLKRSPVWKKSGWPLVGFICFSCLDYYLSLCWAVHEYSVWWWQKESDSPRVLHRWSIATPIVSHSLCTETTCTEYMQKFWCLPESSDSSHTCWKVDLYIPWNLWWTNYPDCFLLSINPRQMYTFLKFHHTALPESQQHICGEIQTLDSPAITVIRTAILQRDQWAKLAWQQTLGVAELQKAVHCRKNALKVE